MSEMPETRGAPSASRGVTVVIPCYDSADFVADAVGSVLEQNHRPVQIVVVNDGSSDGDGLTRALRPFESAVIRIDTPHLGLAAARNRGVRAADHPYLAFLDADDQWKPGFLDRQLALLDETGADAVYCDAELFGPLSGKGGTVMGTYPSRGRVTAGSILAGDCTVVMSAIVARTDRVRQVGGFDPSFAFCEDVDLWVRMIEAGSSFQYQTAVLSRRRVHARNMSWDGEGMARGMLQVFEHHVGGACLTAGERRRVQRRIGRVRSSLHLLLAKAAIAEERTDTARRELWSAFRSRGSWKALLGALSLTLAPGPTGRWLRRRYESEPTG